jgi:presenilin-like A22 family membrane protease
MKRFLSQYLEIMGVFALSMVCAIIIGYSIFYLMSIKVSEEITTPFAVALYAGYIIFMGFLMSKLVKDQKKNSKMEVKSKKPKQNEVKLGFTYYLTTFFILYVIYELSNISTNILLKTSLYGLMAFLVISTIIITYVSMSKNKTRKTFENIVVKIQDFSQENRKFITISINVIAGVGIGSLFSFNMAILMFFIMAMYDFIAVFITKHMVTLAKYAVQMNPFAIYMSEKIYQQKIDDLNEAEKFIVKNNDENIYTYELGEFKNIQKKIPKSMKQKIHDIYKSNNIPILSVIGLGSGDFIFSEMVVVASLHASIALAMVAIIGVITGLGITFIVSNYLKRILPALPTIGLGIALAFIIFFLV